MATSRFLPEIVDWFNKALKLEVQADKEDVKRFVAGQICRLPRCIQRDSALQEVVQEKIVEAVDGMFLLARLHTDSLLDKRTAKDVKSTLAKLSKGSAALNEAYEEAIRRMEGQLSGDHELAKKVISWITYAKRPLTTTEICCALAVELGEAELDPENIPDVEDLLSVCAGLVVVDQESAVIRLVHYTTQEYFERIQDVWDPGAQLHIASTCLMYLSFSTFRTGSCSTDEEFEERLQDNPFLDYAAKYWGEHAATVEDQICELACSFLSHDKSVSCAVQVLESPTYGDHYHWPYIEGGTGFHLTARLGLTIILEALLSNQVKEIALVLERGDTNGRTPLFLAAEHGHQRMVKLLLDKGVNVNADKDFYDNALYAASRKGHKQIVKLLLDAGANVNTKNRYDNTYTLYAASESGHEQVVKLLLEKDANVNAPGGYYGNAFHAAAYRGHPRVLQLILFKEPTMPLHEPYERSLLWWAAAGGSIATVEALIAQHNFDPRTPNKFGQTPLSIASKKGHIEISDFLAKECGETNVQRQVLSENDDDRLFWTCYVCTSTIKQGDVHFNCQYCGDRNWYICADCEGRRAFCEDATHLLEKWTMEDGHWVEVKS